MRRILLLSAVACLVAGALLTPWFTSAADDPKTGAQPAAQPTGGAPAVLSGDVHDPAFDRYVDLDLATRAWQQADAALLADIGLQLAEGERVLMRPHKAVHAD